MRLPREPLPALNTYSLISRRQLTAQNAVYGTAVRLEGVLLTATARGRASVRDMAVAGASQWLRARPPEPGEDRGRWGHFIPGGARLAHRAALLLTPSGGDLRCHGCGAVEGWASFAHLGCCPNGLVTSTLHHPVKRVLLAMLRSVLPGSSVLDGDLEQHRGQQAGPRGGAWWTWYSAFKRPDIVIVNFPRVGVHTIVDVKTFDAAGASHVRADHTDEFALGAHRELERSLVREYVQERNRQGRLVETHSRSRAIGENELLCAAVSRQGAIGEVLRGLIRRLANLRSAAARDAFTASFNFEEVWVHRISLTVHTQCARRMQLLMGAEEADSPPPSKK